VAVAARAGGEVDAVAGSPESFAPAAASAASGAPGESAAPSLLDLAALRNRIEQEAQKVYPQIARRNGWQGRVLVEMHLDGDGRLADVFLVASSGYPILDEATINAVHRASPFRPIARVVTVPVEYRLIP
jgi:protein TonB